MNKKTILITGGAGFIGSNLCSRLLKEGNKVICVDNLFTGRLENLDFCTLKTSFSGEVMNDVKELNENFTFIKHDVIEPLTIDEPIDEIYHLACPASPPKYQIDPIFTLKTNFLGTLNLLELANQKKCKILLSSTSEVYGEPEITPQREDYRGNVNTIGIRSCYDEGKRIAETLMMDYHNKYKVDTKIVRIFNTYGPNMDPYDGRVVTNLIRQILNNENITIYGDGSQTRSFCYIDDLLDGFIKLMATDYHYPVNIGNPYEISVKELAKILLDIIDSTSVLEYRPLPQDDPTNRKPDITLAKKLLNWEPKIDLETGLKKTILYMT